MSEKRDNWGLGCLGAIVGWLALSALTTATFGWLMPEHPAHPIMIFNFKIIEGTVLGAVTALALAWSRKGEPRRAAWIMVVWSSLLLIGWCALFALDAIFPAAGQSAASEQLAFDLSWSGASVAWALALLVSGCWLLRKHKG